MAYAEDLGAPENIVITSIPPTTKSNVNFKGFDFRDGKDEVE